jgi:hypothetical protein
MPSGSSWGLEERTCNFRIGSNGKYLTESISPLLIRSISPRSLVSCLFAWHDVSRQGVVRKVPHAEYTHCQGWNHARPLPQYHPRTN